MKQSAFIILLIVSLNLQAQLVIPLYSGSIPNSKPYAMKEITMENNGQLLGYRNIAQPHLAVYLPKSENNSGAAVIICPGGGYGMECYRPEGTLIAEAFIKKGIAAIILKYRLPSD
jgi:acetyl esterase/lipase